MEQVAKGLAGEPYRDATPGIQARLTDLRAAWAAEDAPGRDALDALAARAARVGGGLVAVAIQAALLGSITVLTLAPGLPRRLVPLLSWSLALFFGYVVLKLVGRRVAARAARRRARRLVSGEAAPAEPIAAIAWYEQHRRATVLHDDARRLEGASLALYMLSGHFFAFQLSVCAVLALSERDSREGPMLLGLASLVALHLAGASALRLVLGGSRRRATRIRHLAALALGALGAVYALASTPPVLGVGMGVQTLLLVIRGWRVRREVLSERRWLC